MTSAEYFNSSGVDGMAARGLNSGRSAEESVQYAKHKERIKDGVSAGIIVLVWNAIGTFWSAESEGLSTADSILLAGFFSVVFGALLYRLANKRGYISGAILALFLAAGTVANVIGMFQGNPFGLLGVFLNGFFAVMFARATWGAFRLRCFK